MRNGPASERRLARFDEFEVDLRSSELHKAGVRVALSGQPLAFLAALLERPGELVTRDDLRQRLWPDGTFVDFEHGLNAVVKRLRDALGDSADAPRFIETVPRRGYRFIAPVEEIATAPAAAAPDRPPTRRSGVISRIAPLRKRRGGIAPQRYRSRAIAAVAAVAVTQPGCCDSRGRIKRRQCESSPQALNGWSLGRRFARGTVCVRWDGERQDNSILRQALRSSEVRRLTTRALVCARNGQPMVFRMRTSRRPQEWPEDPHHGPRRCGQHAKRFHVDAARWSPRTFPGGASTAERARRAG